jgi:hypothetical protein
LRGLRPPDLGPLPPYVQFQLDWYTRAAVTAHCGYLLCDGIALVAATAVPVAVYLDWKLIAAALGAAAAAASGIGLLACFKSNFMTRSYAVEEIRSAIAQYRAKPTVPTNDSELVDRVKTIVLAETSQWRKSIGNSPAAPIAPPNDPG